MNREHTTSDGTGADDPERGQRIRERRRELGYRSRPQLASAVGVHEKTIENWENGRPIAWQHAQRLARVLRVDVHELLGTEPPPDDEVAEATLADHDLAMRRMFRDIVGRIDTLEQQLEQLVGLSGDVAALRQLLADVALTVQRQRTAAGGTQPRAAESPRREDSRSKPRRRSTDRPQP